MYYAYYLIHCMWITEYNWLAWQSHELWFSGSMDASIELDSDIALVLGKAAHALAYASPRLEIPQWADSLTSFYYPTPEDIDRQFAQFLTSFA